MRPASIQAFDKALLLRLAIDLVSTLLNWQAVTARAAPRLAALGLGQGFVVATVVLSLAIYLLLWFFIARRASRVAKWIFVVLTGFSVLNFLGAVASRGLVGDVYQLLAVAVLALQVYGAWLLFRPDAQAWFEGRNYPGARGPIA
jgi:predicted permease